MRLTKKDIVYKVSGACIERIPDIVEGHKFIGSAITKLGQLEDIEEELGIDLITLFKLLTSNFYIKSGKNVYKTYLQGTESDEDFGHNLEIMVYTMAGNHYGQIGIKTQYCINNTLYSVFLKLREYGKTFALTKEVLL